MLVTTWISIFSIPLKFLPKHKHRRNSMVNITDRSVHYKNGIFLVFNEYYGSIYYEFWTNNHLQNNRLPVNVEMELFYFQCYRKVFTKWFHSNWCHCISHSCYMFQLIYDFTLTLSIVTQCYVMLYSVICLKIRWFHMERFLSHIAFRRKHLGFEVVLTTQSIFCDSSGNPCQDAERLKVGNLILW